MPEKISREDVAHVARLARLTLTDAELDRFTHQLADVLDHAGEMALLDTAGVAPMTHPYPLRNVMREDVEGALTDRDELLAMAPVVEDHMFKVPPVLGETP